MLCKGEYGWNANTLVSRDPPCHEARLAADILSCYVCNIDEDDRSPVPARTLTCIVQVRVYVTGIWPQVYKRSWILGYNRDNCGLRVHGRVPFARSAVLEDPKSITWLYGVGAKDRGRRKA